MQWPGVRDWLFATKTFAAAMLALFIALSLGLDRPYWAMASAYIAAKPLSGATRSKAVFRLAGTVIGAAAAVILVPPLSSAPELLSLALAIWVAGCLYLSLLDRTPRSYACMLAGYTATIIGFPSVAAPGAIFETALTRLLEIAIGVSVASLVAAVVFPRPVGAALANRIDAWLANARDWSREALAGEGDPQRSARRLAADAVEINLLASQLSYDALGWETRQFGLLRARMIMLLPVLASIADRVAALGEAMPPAMARLAGDVGEWVSAPWQRAEAMLDRIDTMEAWLAPRSDWTALLLTSLTMRLRDLTQIMHDCTLLRRHMGSAVPLPETSLLFAPDATAASAWHRDHGMALLSAVACGVAILLCCAVWIATAWPQGAVAAELVAVACSFFAAQDDPVPAIMTFLTWSAAAVVVDGTLLFGLLPHASGFMTLMLSLAPAYVLGGIFVSMPATASGGRAFTANGATLLALQDAYAADFPTFVNSGLAFLLALVIAATVTRLIRSVGAGFGVRRLMRTIRLELAVAAERRGGHDRARYAGLMLDRLGLIGARLAEAQEAPDRALADIRVGLNVIDLRRARHSVTAPVRERIDAMLDALAAYYRRDSRSAMPKGAVLPAIDAALEAVAEAGSEPGRPDALLGLVGVRRGLFPGAPPRAA
nr:FUSC family protein [uncultured Rhodopila sp.]